MKTLLIMASLILALTASAQLPDTLWTHAYGTTGADIGNAVQHTTDGGFVVAGSCGAQLYVFKTDSMGESVWSHLYARPSTTSSASAVVQTTDGGYAVAGFLSYGPSDSSFMWLLRLDADGDSLFTRTYSHSWRILAYDLQQTTDGGFILGGYDETQADMIAVKTDSLGNAEWTHTYGGQNNECCYAIDQTTDGGYALFG